MVGGGFDELAPRRGSSAPARGAAPAAAGAATNPTPIITMQVAVRLDQAAVFAGDEISGDCIASCAAGAEGVVQMRIVGRCVTASGNINGDLCILQSAVAEFTVSSSSNAARFTCRLPLSICPTYRSDVVQVHYHVQTEIMPPVASEGPISRVPFRVLATPPDSEQATSTNWNLFCERASHSSIYLMLYLSFHYRELNSPRNCTFPTIR
jgi:hypothetical protein